MLHRFADIHTHKPGKQDSILSIPISGVEGIVRSNAALSPEERQYYSLQLHPWHLTGQDDIADFEATARRLASDPQLVAIGECGLDSLCTTPLELQHQAFIAALHLARTLRKPVIVHCVRLWAEMIRDVHSVFPELKTQPDAWQQWPVIVHGYRRGAQLAKQLLDAGFALSLGEKYKPEVANLIPPQRLYRETDEE